MMTMKHPLIAASALSTAVGLALVAQAPIVRAQGANPPQIVKDNVARMAKDKLELTSSAFSSEGPDCALICSTVLITNSCVWTLSA